MEKKSLSIIPLGMNQDTSVVQMDQQSAFEIRNMRITTTGKNTNLCLKNEKSNKKVESVNLEGIVIGCQELSDYVILFIKHQDDTDSIVKVYETTLGDLAVNYLFEKGNLNFTLDNPIESIGIYENENIQKIYWVDGINSPRVINVCKTYKNDNSSQFDFIPILNNDEPLNLKVSPVFNSNANFTGGVIQYAVSYYNKYRQQSPIIYQSPLYYISDNGRGLNPDGSQKSSTSFELNISNISENWDYLRVYRIMRTTLDSTPSVEYIGEYNKGFYHITSSISSLTSTNTNTAELKYGESSNYIKEGKIVDIFNNNTLKFKEPESPNPTVVIVNSVGMHNTNKYTNENLYIRFLSDNGTKEYIIPKDKIARIQWENTEDYLNLSKPYRITIADEEDPFEHNSGEYISEVKEGIKVYDTGTTGTSVDPSELLFLGGTDLIAGTIEHKDGTLFLGNITDSKPLITKEVKEEIKNRSTLEFKLSGDNSNTTEEDIANTLNTQWIFNSNLLKNSKESTHFQCGEVYRFGVQFLSKKGTWSEVVYLGDLENDKRIVPYHYNDGIKNKPVLKANIYLPEEIKTNYTAAKLVCVYPTIQDRNVLCQGIVCPTLYNIKDRLDNSPYVQSSWFTRPNYFKFNDYDAYVSSGYKGSEMFKYRKDLKGFPLEFRMIGNNGVMNLPPPSEYNSEVQYGIQNEELVYGNYEIAINASDSERKSNFTAYFNNFGIDKTVVTLHSPELDSNYSEELLSNSSLGAFKFKITGYVPVKTTFSDINVEVENPFNPYIGKLYNSKLEDKSTQRPYISGMSMSSFPFWVDSFVSEENTYTPENINDHYWFASFPIYPWHRKGSLNNQGKQSDSLNRKSVLKKKTISNLRIGLPTRYISPYTSLNISNVEFFNTSNIEVKKLNVWGKSINYYGNVDKLLTVDTTQKQPIYLATYIISSYKDKIETSSEEVSPNDLVNGNKIIYNDDDFGIYRNISKISTGVGVHVNNAYSNDSLPIQYQSSSHAVFAFEKDDKGNYTLLPNIVLGEDTEEDDPIKTIEVNCTISNYKLYKRYNFEYPEQPGYIVIGDYGNGENNSTGIIKIECTKGYKIKSVTPYTEGAYYNHMPIGSIVYINDEKLIYNYNNLSPYLSPYGCYNTYYIDNPSSDITLNIGKNGEDWGYTIKRLDIEIISETSGYTKIISFNITGIGDNVVEPTIEDNTIYLSTTNIDSTPVYTSNSESYSNIRKDTANLIWEKEGDQFSGFYQDIIKVKDVYLQESYDSLFYYIVGELYRDNVLNRFGGTSEQALASNVWTTCGDIVFFNNTSNITLIGDQGDTYYCRYDHLKTQPLGEGKVNNIVDIVSFMCETRINIDGRYDRNRGLESNLHITSNNFNLFNKVYSQRNNFFTGSYLRTDDLFNTKFPSQIMWTKTKVLGEEIDSWTNIIPTSVLDLDRDKGDLISLTKYGNEIWAFQEKGISKILYNSRVQLNASDGIPIEIANSGKVDGKVYLPYNYGCQNKGSIVEGTGGLYFIDNYNSAILNIGPDGSLVDVSATKGMVSWVNSFKELFNYSWNLSDFNSIRSLYDPNTKDIYFTTDKEALAFNELIGKFTSFYSYDKVSNLFNIKGKTYQIRGGEIWELHGGKDYGKFFSESSSNYSIEIIANSEFSTDKIFDTVEFRTNDEASIEYGKTSYYPFNELKVTNDYQSSETDNKTLKKKFRIWRWQIGRCGRDRIRNPWAKFTLEGNLSKELKLYDMNIVYYT
jgi:hypothetical protein